MQPNIPPNTPPNIPPNIPTYDNHSLEYSPPYAHTRRSVLVVVAILSGMIVLAVMAFFLYVHTYIQSAQGSVRDVSAKIEQLPGVESVEPTVGAALSDTSSIRITGKTDQSVADTASTLDSIDNLTKEFSGSAIDSGVMIDYKQTYHTGKLGLYNSISNNTDKTLSKFSPALNTLFAEIDRGANVVYISDVSDTIYCVADFRYGGLSEEDARKALLHTPDTSNGCDYTQRLWNNTKITYATSNDDDTLAQIPLDQIINATSNSYKSLDITSEGNIQDYKISPKTSTKDSSSGDLRALTDEERNSAVAVIKILASMKNVESSLDIDYGNAPKFYVENGTVTLEKVSTPSSKDDVLAEQEAQSILDLATK